MDLRNSKRKHPISENVSYKKISAHLSRDQSHIGASEEDSFYSCTSNSQSVPNSLLEPRAFLEGTESFDHITIVVDPNNPGIMPQEVTVYGYENALFMPNDRKRENRVMFSPNLTNSMYNLCISPHKLLSTTNPKQLFTKTISSQDTNSNSSFHLLNDEDRNDQVTSSQSDFLHGIKHGDESGIHLIPPCTQTIGHKIDPISKYILTPNPDDDYLSNIQFNCVSFLPGKRVQMPHSHSDNTKPNIRAEQRSSKIPFSTDNDLLDDTDEKSFKCTLCHQTFAKLTNYLTHLRSHINTHTLVCEICRARISCTSQIANHISTHSGTDVFPCKFCSSVFYQDRTLKVHLSMRSSGVTFSCRKCSMKFCSKTGLISHKLIHYNVGKFLCDTCSLKFDSAFALRFHLMNYPDHSRNELSKLSLPRKQMQTRYKLSRSNAIRQSQTLTKFSRNTKHRLSNFCPHCSRKFINVIYLKAHIHNNTCRKKPKDYSNVPVCVCRYCSRVFSKEMYLKLHLRKCILKQTRIVPQMNESQSSQNLTPSVINDNSPTVFPTCPNCSKVFSGSRSIRQHLRKGVCNQVPVEKKSFLLKCPNCKKIFAHRNLRDYHQASCFPPNNNKLINGKSLKNKSSKLKPRKFKDNSPLICEVCKTSFRRIIFFQKHIRDGICSSDRTKTNNSLLKYKSLFASKRALTCSTCQLIMGSIETLRRHERSGKCKSLDSKYPSVSSGEEGIDGSIESDIMNTPRKRTKKQPKRKEKLNPRSPKKQIPSSTTTKILSCLYCYATFDSRAKFKSHIESANCVKGISQLRTVCSACYKSFYNTFHIRRHVRTSCRFFKTQSKNKFL